MIVEHRNRRRFRCGPVIALIAVMIPVACLLTCSAVHAAEAVLDIDSSQIEGQIRPELFGAYSAYTNELNGIPNWLSTKEEYRSGMGTWSTYMGLVDELGPSILTYPGGYQQSNDYHWKDGIGEFEARPEASYHSGMRVLLGTDEFLRFAEEMDAATVMVVSVLSLESIEWAVQNAADWVEYCNAQTGENPDTGLPTDEGIEWAARRASNGRAHPYSVRYWLLGDETYGSLDAAAYAERIVLFSSAMKAIDPSIEIIASGMNDQAAWYETILSVAGDHFDLWDIHYFYPGYSDPSRGFRIWSPDKTVTIDHYFPETETYTFTAYTSRDSLSPGRIDVYLDDGPYPEASIAMTSLFVTSLYSFTLPIEAGWHRLQLRSPTATGITAVQLYPIVQIEGVLSGTDYIDLKDSDELYPLIQSSAAYMNKIISESDAYLGGKRSMVVHNTIYDWFVPEQHTLREALSFAENLIVLAEQSDRFDLATTFRLFGDSTCRTGLVEGVASDWESGIKEGGRPDPNLRPHYFVQSLFRNLLSGERLSCRVDSSGYTVLDDGLSYGVAGSTELRVDEVRALAGLSPGGRRLNILVVNKDRDEEAQLTVNISGAFASLPVGTLYTITGDSPKAHNDPDDCALPLPPLSWPRDCVPVDCPEGGCVGMETAEIEGAAQTFSATVPPRSISAMVLLKSGADHEPPGSPSGLSVEVTTPGHVALSWIPPEDADVTGYKVHRAIHYGSPALPCKGPYRYSLNSSPWTSETYVDSDMDLFDPNGDEILYCYAVRALDADGNESEMSEAVVAVPASECTPEDLDCDGVLDTVDNCPSVWNPVQSDLDGDGAGDYCDVCPMDVMDDSDQDGVCADQDNCPFTPNPGQDDGDGDGAGAACDCDDTNPEVSPWHKEVMGNGIDDDCDGKIDEFTCFISAGGLEE